MSPMNPRLLRPRATGFSPKSIAGLGFWIDASQPTAVALNGSSVSSISDQSGNGKVAAQPTAANQPAYTATMNGLKVVSLSASPATNLFISNPPNNSGLTVLAALRRTGDGSRMLGFATASGAEDIGAGGTGWLALWNATAQGFANGAGRSNLPGGLATNESAVVSLTHSGAAILNYKNGIAGTADAGVVGLRSSFARFYLGGNSDTAAFSFSLDVGEVLCYTRVLSDGERQKIENYLGRKWGIAVAPTVSNADAQDWINRVYTNGGSVSASTANAVNTFCNAIDAAGIRSKFYRLNLFCGSSVTAALIPLYRSSSYGGAVLGGASDTNVNFVSGDYSESLGLAGTGNNGIGAGSSKYLNTGLAPTAWPAISSFHASAFVFGVNQSGANQGTPIGIRNNTAPANRWGFDYRQTYVQILGGAGLNTFASMPSSPTNQHWLASRQSVSSFAGYINGVSQVTDTTDVTSTLAARASNFFVFAQNTDNLAAQYFSFRMGGYSLGTGLTQSEATSFNAAMQAFQTALGRQV